MSGRYVSVLSPAERVHLEYLEAQAPCQHRPRSVAARQSAAADRENRLRVNWVALAEDDLRHEREILSEWARHHRAGVRRERQAVAVTLAGLIGVVCGVAVQLFA
jgi:hypothetical protein